MTLSAITAEQPAGLRHWLGFVAVSRGMLMAALDIQIVASSLPEIQAALSIPPDRLSWVQTAYLSAEIVAIPLTGWATRVLSTRGAFTVCVLGFTAASAACAISDDFGWLIAARIVQGFYGGFLLPPGLSRGGLCCGGGAGAGLDPPRDPPAGRAVPRRRHRNGVALPDASDAAGSSRGVPLPQFRVWLLVQLRAWRRALRRDLLAAIVSRHRAPSRPVRDWADHDRDRPRTADHGAGRDIARASRRPAPVDLRRLWAARRRPDRQRLHDAGRRFLGPVLAAGGARRRFHAVPLADDIDRAELFSAGRGRQRLRPVQPDAQSRPRDRPRGGQHAGPEPGAGACRGIGRAAAGRRHRGGALRRPAARPAHLPAERAGRRV